MCGEDLRRSSPLTQPSGISSQSIKFLKRFREIYTPPKCWRERGLVASRRARRRRCSARCGVLVAPRDHTSATLCSGADHRCHLRRLVWPSAVRMRRRPHTVYCVPVRGCVASRALLSTALCAVLRWPRYAFMSAPPCAQAPIVGAAAARISMAQPRPGVADSRERLRDHVCNHTVRWRGGEASAAAHAACAQV